MLGASPLTLTFIRSFNELGVIVTVPVAFGRQALMLGDGTMLKVNAVLGWALALAFAWASESERLEAPAACAQEYESAECEHHERQQAQTFEQA